MEIKTISIIGAGQMGHGIAQSLALTGYDVLINDISLEIINSGLQSTFQCLFYSDKPSSCLIRCLISI